MLVFESKTNILVNFPDIISSERSDFTNAKGYLWIQSNAKHVKCVFSGNIYSLQCRVNSKAGFQYIPQFSLYPYKTNVHDAKIINLFGVIHLMKSNELKEKSRQISEARILGDSALKTRLKDGLPYLTHTGIFSPRRNDGLVLPGFTYQLDIDKINDPGEVLEKIINDKQLTVLIASISPSGNGVKALLFLKELLNLRDSWGHEQYREAYHQATDILFEYFKVNHGVCIDTQMKAISQPFYLFHSPNLFINKNLLPWI